MDMHSYKGSTQARSLRPCTTSLHGSYFRKSGTTLCFINFSLMPLCLASASTLYLASWLRRLDGSPLVDPRRFPSIELRPDRAASGVSEELPFVLLLGIRSSLLAERSDEG